MVEQHVTRSQLREVLSALNEAAARGSRRAETLSWLLTDTSGIAPIYQLLNAVLACGLVWLPYEYLVEFSMFLSVPSICLFMWAFCRLRYLSPAQPRPFTVPGGNVAAILITIIPVGVSLLYGAIVIGAALGEAETHEDVRRKRSATYQLCSAVFIIGGGLCAHLTLRAVNGGARAQRYMAHFESELAELPPSHLDDAGAADGGDCASSATKGKLRWAWKRPAEAPVSRHHRDSGQRAEHAVEPLGPSQAPLLDGEMAGGEDAGGSRAEADEEPADLAHHRLDRDAGSQMNVEPLVAPASPQAHAIPADEPASLAADAAGSGDGAAPAAAQQEPQATGGRSSS